MPFQYFQNYSCGNLVTYSRCLAAWLEYSWCSLFCIDQLRIVGIQKMFNACFWWRGKTDRWRTRIIFWHTDNSVRYRKIIIDYGNEMALVEKVKFKCDPQGWVRFWINSNFVIWPNLDSFILSKEKEVGLKRRYYLFYILPCLKHLLGTCLPLSDSPLNIKYIWVKMKYDVSSHCGAWLKGSKIGVWIRENRPYFCPHLKLHFLMFKQES